MSRDTKLTQAEKDALDEKIIEWLRANPGWHYADQVASGVSEGPRFGPGHVDGWTAAMRLRTLKKRGRVRNRMAASPYMAGTNEWKLALGA